VFRGANGPEVVDLGLPAEQGWRAWIRRETLKQLGIQALATDWFSFAQLR
jgi:hypothetical protein